MIAAAAIAMASGCVGTQSVNDEEALTRYPQSGLESIAGSWAGTWKGLTGRSTLKVTTREADHIEVKYCYDAWCAGGCTTDPCGWHANTLDEIEFENEQLKFSSRGRPFVFERDGAGLRGTYKDKYQARMKRRRE